MKKERNQTRGREGRSTKSKSEKRYIKQELGDREILGRGKMKVEGVWRMEK